MYAIALKKPAIEISNKYGIKAYYLLQLEKGTYYVKDWDDFCTEEEIKERIKDWQMIQSLEGGE